MNYEHGLISVGAVQRENLPSGAKLFIDIDGTLRRVKKITATQRGILVLAGKHRQPVIEDDMLVISYNNLAGEDADTTIKNSRVAGLPLKDLLIPSFIPSNYAGMHCG